MSGDEFAFVFALLEEGAPDEEILARISDHCREDAAFLQRLVGRLCVYRESIQEDADIPENIVDDDGVYARMRSLGQEVLPRLERIIGRLAITN